MRQNDYIGAVIVTYNPDETIRDRIEKLIEIDGLKKIIIVDNSIDSKVLEKVKKDINSLKVVFKFNKENLGIAKALNQGIQEIKKECKWVLTLDQDSNIYSGLVTKYKDIIENEHYKTKIAIIGTNYIDINSKTPYKKIGEDLVEVEEVISSGSLLNIDIFESLGGFNSKYFIDQVDNEYCYRVRKKGYKIKFLQSINMSHSLGNITKKKFVFWELYLYNQNPIRTYYRTRNKIYFMKMYKDKELTKILITHLLKDIIRILNEKQSLRKIMNFIKGVRDGVKG